MSIRVVCSICRKRSKFPDQFAGHDAECRKCGNRLAIPGPDGHTKAEPAEPVEPAPVQTRPLSHAGSARWNKWSLARAREHWVGRRMERDLERKREQELEGKQSGRKKAAPRNRRRQQVAGSCCRACEDGNMRLRTVHRCGGALAIAGYALLLPAILGLIINFVILAAGAFGLTKAISGVTRIPAPTVEIVIRLEELTEEHMKLMSPAQRRAVRTARIATTGATLGGLGSRGGSVGFGVVAWLLVGLVGWLLSRRKQVIRCTTCDLTAPIS